MFLHSKIMDTLVRWNLEKGHDDDDDSDMYLTGFTNVSDWDTDFSQLESQQSFNDSVAPHVRTKRRSRRKKNGSHFNVGSGIRINSNTKHSSLKKESNLATNNKLQHSESSNVPSLKPTSRKNSFKKQRLPHQHHRVGNNSDTSYSFSWATFASKWKTAVQSHSHSLRQGDDGSRKPFSTSTFPGINDSFPNDATVPLDSTIERSPITFRQAEILLRATDLMLNMTSTSRGAIYQQLLSDLPGFWNAMCSGAIPNGKPVIVTSKTAVLQVVKLDMDTILSSTESISFGTKDSSNSNGHYVIYIVSEMVYFRSASLLCPYFCTVSVSS